MCIVNVSTFHFGAPSPSKTKNKNKKREKEQKWMRVSLFFASEQKLWKHGELVMCLPRGLYLRVDSDFLFIYRSFRDIQDTLNFWCYLQISQLMILTRQNFSYLSLITAIILCKPQIHLMKNTQLLFLAKQINQCFVEHL